MPGKIKTYLIHIGLFIATFLTTSLAGCWLITQEIWPSTWENFMYGTYYSVPLLLFLTCHEFGHYFTARYHKVKSSLPYYIPLPHIITFIGTAGAIIRLKQRVKSLKHNFDIGISGPLAGFVIAIGVLIFGFSTLPDKDEYIFTIHPEYQLFGENYEQYVYDKDTFALKSEVEKLTNKDLSGQPDTMWLGTAAVERGAMSLSLGKNLAFIGLEKVFADQSKVPNAHEVMHYPFLFAGFLALLFTALNLLPVGQLDGGHVLYGLVGAKRHKIIAQIIFLAFILYAGMGIITPFDNEDTLLVGSLPLAIALYILFLMAVLRGLKFDFTKTLMVALIIFTIQFTIPMLIREAEGYSGWLFFAFIVGRFLGVYHPPVAHEQPLSKGRIMLGWIALIIFIISFSPAPLIIG